MKINTEGTSICKIIRRFLGIVQRNCATIFKDIMWHKKNFPASCITFLTTIIVAMLKSPKVCVESQ